MDAPAQPSFWSSLWAKILRVGRPVVAILPAVLIVLGAVVLLFLGVKNIQIGGLLGKLFGHKPKTEGTVVEIANSVPEGRVDPQGKIIPPGSPDSQGVTQATVVPIQTPGLFDDPSKVKILPPGETTPIVVDLPDGVTAKDIDKVIIVRPEVFAVTVKDSSPVTGQQVDDLLKKYGG